MKMNITPSNLLTTPLLLAMCLSLSACGACSAEEDEPPPVVQKPDVCDISPTDVLDCEMPPKESEDAFVVINSSKDLEPLCASRCNRFYALSIYADAFTFEDLSFLSHVIEIYGLSLASNIRSIKGTEQLKINNLNVISTFSLKEMSGFSGTTTLSGVTIVENEDLEAVQEDDE